MTRQLLRANTIDGSLRLVVDAALRVVGNADLVSVTLRGPGGEFFTPVRSADVAGELDRAQYLAGDGPCLDAARPGGPAHASSDDLVVETRWPGFTAAAARYGCTAVLSVELPAAGGPDQFSGSLNLYSCHPHRLTGTDRYAALLLASHGALALARARAAELADLLESRLRQAIDSRDTIGQAKGILMHREGVTADEAFDLLRRTSQDLNIKLVELARTLVTRHTDLDGGQRPG